MGLSSEQFALDSLRALPDGVVMLDDDWTYRFVNDAACGLLGASADDLLGRRYHDVYPEAAGTPFEQAYARVLQSGAPETLEEWYQPWDRCFRNRVVKTPGGLAIFFSDVTDERRRADSAGLHYSLLQQAMDFAPVGIVLQDLDGRYRLVNRFAAERAGQPPESMIGRTAADFVPATLAARWAETEAAVMAAGHPQAGDLTLRAADGRVAHYENVVFPTYDAGGALSGTGAVYSDVTLRQETEQKLREANAALIRFQALVEASDDFIAIADLDGRVSYLNPAGRSLVHLDPDTDVSQSTIADYLTAEGLARSVEVEQPAVLRSGRWRGESTLRDHRDGSAIPVAIASFLMRHPDTGEPLGLATVQRDITERVEAERRLRAMNAQRHALLTRLVESQEHERARIAADVHDDSVQALAAVDLRLGVLKRSLVAERPDVLDLVGQLQHNVSAATDRLRRLLFDLEAPATDQPLAEAIRDVAGHLFDDATASFTMRGDITADLPYAERVKAVRIAKEALSNAVQHSAAEHVSVELAAVRGGVELVIADDGCGLDPARASSPPGHRGLATMRDRAALAGGTWQLERTEPKGTTVRVWLPGASSAG